MTVKISRRLKQLHQAAAAGDAGAANRAKALATYLGKQADANAKRADDQVKAIAGAWMGAELTSGRPVVARAPRDVLTSLNDYLKERPSERLAILGEDGQGSQAFWRVMSGPPSPD